MFKRRHIIPISSVLAVLLLAVGAYAYWTTTGSGTGAVANAQSNGVVTLHASWPAAALVPGGSQTVSFTDDNAGTTDLFVGTVTSVVTTSDPGCLASDFTVDPVVEDQIIPNGSSSGI